jgi:hypothetical protein
MTDEPVNTGDNRQKPPGTFAKGDPRINRKGRPRVPKSALELNKLIDEIAAEDVTNPVTGEQIQRIRAMLRSMMTGKDSRGKVEILNRRYGKVKDEVEHSGGASLVIKIIKASDGTDGNDK